MEEIIELRDLYNKVYDTGTVTENGEKIYQAAQNFSPVHYLTDDGRYEDIDLTILPVDYVGQYWEFEYYCKKNNFAAYFNDYTDVNNSFLVSFEITNKNGVKRWINYKLFGSTPDSTIVDGNKIKYTNVYKDTDIEYIINETQLKEDIILKTASAPKDFEFTIKVSDGLTYELIDNEIVFTDLDTGEIIYKITKPYMFDNDGNKGVVSYKISSREINNEVYPSIIVETDKNFFYVASYPVTIDPSTESVLLASGTIMLNAVFSNDTKPIILYYERNFNFSIPADRTVVSGNNFSFKYNTNTSSVLDMYLNNNAPVSWTVDATTVTGGAMRYSPEIPYSYFKGANTLNVRSSTSVTIMDPSITYTYTQSVTTPPPAAYCYVV